MTRGQIFLFIGLFLLGLVLFIPLSLALSWVGQGMTARAATGTIWSGRLLEAQFGRLPLGDVAVGLRPIDILQGRMGIAMQSGMGRGVLSASRHDVAVSSVTANLDGSRLFAPLPIDRLDLANVNAAFVAGRCLRGEGQVRVTFSGDVGGLSLAQGMRGVARCEGVALLLPLVSQSAMERLNLYLQGDGEFRAEFFVRSTDPAQAAKLNAAGFVPAPGGFVRRFAGKL